MPTQTSAHDPYPRKRTSALDSQMAYVDTGSGNPIVFLHGNMTSSYLWRNVIPHVETVGRCLAPDLIGMGDSGKSGTGSYDLADQAKYLDAWFESLGLAHDVALVMHDWGSTLGFDWAYRHQTSVRALIYMEAFVHPMARAELSEVAQRMVDVIRSPEGEELILRKNIGIERLLPAGVLRGLTEEELTHYRRPYLEPGSARQPILAWLRQIPLDGDPADVAKIVDRYSKWLAASSIPKLFIEADHGLLPGSARALCRTWSNQTHVTVEGGHCLQEDSPAEVGHSIAVFLASLTAPGAGAEEKRR